MKLLKDYKENELVKITGEEKQQLFLLECADRGVTLPSATPKFICKPEMEDKFKPDTTVFIIKHGWNDICFAKNRDGADEIVKALIFQAILFSAEPRVITCYRNKTHP